MNDKDSDESVVEEVEEIVTFPPGFRLFTKAKRHHDVEKKRMMCTFSKNKTLIFNKKASRYIFGLRNENVGCLLAYNQVQKVLAVKPLPYNLKSPRTYKIIAVGGYKDLASICFGTQSKVWGIPMVGASYPCFWNDKDGLMMISLVDL